MYRHIKEILIIACIFLTCSFTSALAGETMSVTFGAFPGGSDQPFKVANLLGFDKKHGVEIIIKTYAEFPMLNLAIGSHQVDFGSPGPGPMAVLRGKGMDTCIIYGAIIPANEVIVRADSHIKTFADLRGRTVNSHGGPAGSTFLDFRVACKLSAGFDPIKDCKIQWGAPSLNMGLLEKRETDAVVSMEPFATRMLSNPALFRTLGECGQIYTKFTGKMPPLVAAYSSSDTIVRQKKEALKRVIACYLESVQYMKTHKEIWSTIAKWDGITDPKTADLYRERYADDFVVDWNNKAIQDQIEGLLEYIKINPDFAPAKVLPEAFSHEFIR